MNNGNVAHFALPANHTAKHNITAGLPAQVSKKFELNLEFCSFCIFLSWRNHQ